MRTSRPTRRTLAALGVVALLGAACRNDPASPAERLRATVQLDRATVVPGQTVRITVRVSNPTRHTITIYGSGSCTIGFALRTPDGERFPLTDACTDDLHEFVFAPGESQTRVIEWTARRQVNAPGDGFTWVPLPAGRYRVSGRVAPSDPKGYLEGPAVDLTILPT